MYDSKILRLMILNDPCYNQYQIDYFTEINHMFKQKQNEI